MPNDLTTLRFSNNDGSTPSIRLDLLQSFCSQMEDIARRVGKDVFGANVDVEIRLSASPRVGSLEVQIQAIVTDIGAANQSIFNTLGSDVVSNALQAVGGMGAFIWLACFGSHGIIDFWTRPSRELDPAIVAENPEIPLVIVVREKFLERPNSHVALSRLVNSARMLGASSVQIQIRGGKPVTVHYDGEGILLERPNPWTRNMTLASVDHPRKVKFRRTGSPDVRCEVLGISHSDPAPLFLAVCKQHTALVAWLCDAPPPKAKIQTTVVGGEIGFARVRPLAKWPGEFLRAKFIIVALSIA